MVRGRAESADKPYTFEKRLGDIIKEISRGFHKG
jgi:hypothetical protein